MENMANEMPMNQRGQIAIFLLFLPDLLWIIYECFANSDSYSDSKTYGHSFESLYAFGNGNGQEIFPQIGQRVIQAGEMCFTFLWLIGKVGRDYRPLGISTGYQLLLRAVKCNEVWNPHTNTHTHSLVQNRKLLTPTPRPKLICISQRAYTKPETQK